MPDPQQQQQTSSLQSEWDQAAAPAASASLQSEWDSAAPQGKQADEKPPAEPNADLINFDTLGHSVVLSKMLGVPVKSAYNNNDLMNKQMKERGFDLPTSTPGIANDIKSGLEGSIFGLSYRNKLPDTIKDPRFLDNFIGGLSKMVADLPFYIMGSTTGTAIGAAAGSEVPGIGNVVGGIAGGGVGTFAVPAAIRESLVQGIQKGDIKSFGDLIDRTLSSLYAGAKEAPTGLAAELSGGATIPLKFLGPAATSAETAMKIAQQGAAIETVSSLSERKIPTADGFAINTALMVAMHVTMGSVDKASELVGKVHDRSLDAYAKTGTHPATIAAEALHQAQESPTDDIVGRINEITRTEPDPEAKSEAAKDTKEEGKEEPPRPAPPLLRPAVRAEDGTVHIGAEGEQHPDIVELTGEDVERGFVDRNDQFHTRDEAKAKLHEEEPEVYDKWVKEAGGPEEEFHTTDYNEAQRKSTGIKNESVDAQREAAGLPPIEGPMRSLDSNNWERAKEDVDSGRVEPLAIAESINRSPRGMTPEETNAVNYYRAQLSNQHKANMDAIEKAREDDDPRAEQSARERLQGVEDKINTVDEATKRSGTEWGLSGVMRQRMIAQDYSLDRSLQRARVASKTGEVSPEVRDQLETLTRQLETANKKLEDHQAKQSEREGQRTVERLQKDAARAGRKAARKEERIGLDEELSALVKQFDSLIMGRMSANPFFDPEVLGLVAKMARNRVESGITRFEDIVDDIHAKLTELGHDISKRDLSDAISGYGRTVEMSKDQIDVALREAKRQGKLISALEDAKAAILPLRSGLQRDKASERVSDLTKQVKQAMRESGIDTRTSQTPEQQWKSALDGIKTRLRNQIKDLTKQLQTGEGTPKREGISYDEEAKVLKAERDSLRKQVQDIEGKPKMSPEQKLKMVMAATEKSIAEYQRRIEENDLTPQQRRDGVPETPELKAMREQRDALKETYRQMKEAANPKKSPEETALARYKAQLQKRIDDMQRQLNTGDFNKEPQQRITLDEEASKLKIEVEKARRGIEEAVRKQEREGRTKTEKAVEFVTKWRRAGLLTGWTTLGKLTKAAMDRMGVTPVEELLGGVLSKIPGISDISDRAPMHGGGLNLSAEVTAVSQLWQKATAKDMWDELVHGQDSLDLLFGGKAKLPPEVLGFFGQLHGALKVPEKRAEFFRRFEIGMEWAKKNNLDVNDPRVQSAVGMRSYLESERAILMQPNAVTNAYSVMLAYLHNQGALGKALEGGARFIFPMVRVATNLPGEAASYTPPALAVRAVEVFRMLADKDKMGKSGFDLLSMHDFDNIMRGLKKGSVGLGLTALGFAFRKHITGYYLSEGDKKRGVKRGIMKIGGVTIPAYLNDTPPLIAIQLAATVGHVWDHYNMKGMSGGLIAGSMQAAEELAKRVPFYGQVARGAESTSTPERSMVSAGELAGSLLIPRLVSQIAEARDKDSKGNVRQRTAKTFTQAIELQVPGLRKRVPVRHSIKGTR